MPKIPSRFSRLFHRYFQRRVVEALILLIFLSLWMSLKIFRNDADYLLLPLFFIPAFSGEALSRARRMKADWFISRAFLYSSLSALAAIGYGLLVSGLSLIFGSMLDPAHPFVVGLMIFILAVLLDPMRRRLQQAVDRVFFRGQTAYRTLLQSFSHELTQGNELSQIAKLLRQYAQKGLQPSRLHVFVYDPDSSQYEAAPDDSGEFSSDMRFESGSPLVETLSRRDSALFLPDLVNLPEALVKERARLALLGCSLFVPLPGRSALRGWLALGNRLSGEAYSPRAVEFLESLGDQAAVAIERAQVVADLERRVRQMNVLTRVAQGTNFTLVFDDILELIFAQAIQLIPAEDFRIALCDRNSQSISYSFYLKDDERLRDRENKPLPKGQSLELEVVRLQRALVTGDYVRECHSRSLMPAEQGLFAWMGVPLNAGAETIGVISVASRDPLQVYTREHQDLLQAIADQAAGAIVKSRLLAETERRARQLATLNEIGRGLTSTLELKPLLNQILQSATEILNCEAGSLFLRDEQTGDLVFEVVSGPVADELVGKRLPSGKGVVGEAVELGQAIIANDVKRHKDWFEKTDEQTGFSTQDLLVVPMQLKERVIGVIEVINKLDGISFDENDRDLLTTFSSQATIAIENARLYTMTDQALAARVEELSVMQRIDRELNASLDVARALQITLDWAMRQSKAQAGLVGIITPQGVEVMASAGYGEALRLSGSEENGDGESRPLLPDSLEGIDSAIRSGQPERVHFIASEAQSADANDGIQIEAEAPNGLLEGAKSRIVLPLRRENEVFGVLLLESHSADFCPDEAIAFLTRLTDHAAIAIANGQLYQEVQEANLAKSKFVSFVAHELKNPMASIKGYTELVAGGMAGPVNEMQSSFLATVRSNVERMNTIVSDLNDLTKIQVGSLRLEFDAVSIQEVIQEAVRSLHRQLEDKEQNLVIEIAEDLPRVWGDRLRMGQVATNLISNAHKYTPQGGQIVVGAERMAEAGGSPARLEVVHVWVKDYGIGIPEEDQGKIFQQYFRTEISKETASGTGLGLNISKSLVEMQGGRIWFESEFGKGTTFHITIPVAEST